MKLVYKLAAIGTILAATVATASAQNTTRRSYDQPSRYWDSGLVGGPAYYSGRGYNNDPSNWRSGNSDTNMFATPGTQEERDIGNQGG